MYYVGSEHEARQMLRDTVRGSGMAVRSEGKVIIISKTLIDRFRHSRLAIMHCIPAVLGDPNQTPGVAVVTYGKDPTFLNLVKEHMQAASNALMFD